MYEKPMNRRNIAVFSPEALMRHLDDGVVAQPSSSGHGQKSVSPPPQSADSQKARRKLAEHFRGVSARFGCNEILSTGINYYFEAFLGSC